MVNSTFSFATISGRLRHGVGVFLAGGLWGLASLSQAACPTPQKPSGEGKSGDPYLIQNVENLYYLTQNEGDINDRDSFVYLKQTADIDAASIDECSAGNQWESPQLVGSYDGGEFTITNLTAYEGHDDLSESNGTGAGLFGALKGSEGVAETVVVKNLILSNFAVGYTDNGTEKGEIASDLIGAIVGEIVSAGDFEISNVKVESLALEVDRFSTPTMGGVIGQIGGGPSGETNVTLSGLVVKSSSFKTETLNDASVGGLIGQLEPIDTLQLTNSYFNGEMKPYDADRGKAFGAIVGNMSRITSSTGPSGTIENIYMVIRDGINADADTGLDAFGDINTDLDSNSSPLTVSGLYQETPGSLPDPNPETLATGIQVTKFLSADLTDEDTFSGFDFSASGPWRMNSLINDGAPYLSWEFSDPQVTVDTSSVPAGAGIAVSPSDDPITVALGQTQSVDITVNDGYVIQIDDSASTCLGTLTGSTYQTQALTEDCTVKINAFTHGNAFDGSVEVAAPNSGDGNNDGVADADQAHVASVPLTTDSGSVVYATLEATGERPLVEVSPNPIDTGGFASLPNLSEGAEAVLGMLEFKALQVTSGATETFTVTVHSEAALEGVLKWNSGTSQWDSIGTVSGQSVTFDITDGGPYDRDGAANGEILDPIVPLTAVPAAEDASDGSDSGDSGGNASNDETAQASEPPPAKPVPTTSSFMLVLLAALMLALVFQQRVWRHTHRA